jgi:hypothetical protein
MSVNIFSNCLNLEVGCVLYLNNRLTGIAPAGKYSDGSFCYTTDSNGIITSKTVCFAPTTTTTSTTSTTSTSTTSTTTLIDSRIDTVLNITATGWIRWTRFDSTVVDTFISSTGTFVITDCILFGSVRAAVPLAQLASWNSIAYGPFCASTTTTSTTTSGTTTLAWSYSETGGANGTMDLYINGFAVESRSSTSSGTYSVNVGDTIYVELQIVTACGAPDDWAKVYTTGNILTDANCAENAGVSLTTGTYTVVSGDIGSTLTLNTFASCDGGCL